MAIRFWFFDRALTFQLAALLIINFLSVPGGCFLEFYKW
jgi:hypothetical protein